MKNRMTRRGFVKQAVAASTATGLALGEASLSAAEAARPALSAPLAAPRNSVPMGKIKNVEFSRLMLGGNLITGYAHSRDLSYVGQLMKHYNTEAKILETLELAEIHGINAVNTAVWDDNSFLQKHWDRGGKMKWIAQAVPHEKDVLADFKKAIDGGACAVHIQGHGAEQCVEGGELDKIGQIVDYIKSRKVISGIAAHSLEVIKKCVQAGLDPDFYQKTLHTHDYHSAPRPGEKGYLGRYDNSWCNDPEEVIDVMFPIKKPWIAFKVMAAGAIPPRRAFQHAFNSGADFVLAGMFDWQVAEDVRIAKETLAEVKRTRPWYS
jgi:hypothetical protein